MSENVVHEWEKQVHALTKISGGIYFAELIAKSIKII